MILDLRLRSIQIDLEEDAPTEGYFLQNGKVRQVNMPLIHVLYFSIANPHQSLSPTPTIIGIFGLSSRKI